MSINKFVRVKDEPNLLRDINSKGIVSVDSNGLSDYKKAKEKRIQKNKTILQYENDINTLKNEVTEIKDSLKMILDRLTPRN